MEPSQDINKRLTDLEIKASFGEDLLEQLNQVVIRQQQQIDLLIREVGRLHQPANEAGAPGVSRAGDDLPPHY
ncbi:MAG: SlyX family protein [Polaromonas sp.]|nr:SlyX family protein [Polaromonas sp.]MDP3355335.1 SlyX family protein [Polaromonas sp.]MDP3750244.1 SlyX family protein [Polaromonas sp.]